jgi:hypothetical protein
MLNKKKSMLFLLILVSLCAPVAAADTVIAQYVKNGGNGGFPYETLKVYQSGKAELITDNFSSSSTINYTLTPTELGDLVKLFTDNNFSSLDSMYMSGCLACPVWNITYGKKKVSGNFTGTSVPLANIKAGLDALVVKIKNSATIIYLKSPPADVGRTAASPFRARLNVNHSAGASGIDIVRKGNAGAYTVLGRQTLQAQ